MPKYWMDVTCVVVAKNEEAAWEKLTAATDKLHDSKHGIAVKEVSEPEKG